MTDNDSASTITSAGISDFILELYRHSEMLPQERYKAWALDGLKQVLPFDSAFWAEGAEFGATIVDAHIHNSVHPANEWLEDYAQFKEDDPLALAVFENRGKTIYDADLMPREAWLADPLYGPFCRKHQIAYTLCTMDYNPTTTLVEVISVYRADSTQPYTKEEQQRMQFLFPHLLETRRRNFQASDQSLDSHGPPLLETRTPAAESGAYAICNATGMLYRASDAFTDLLLTEAPEWQGPILPWATTLKEAPRKHLKVKGTRVILHARRRENLFYLHIQPRTPIDDLTAAEHKVARELMTGSSYKAAAQHLKLSPSTINNHAAAIYRKLGINNKAALVSRWQELIGGT